MGIFEAVDKFIPSKPLKLQSGLPWVNSRIRREIWKRERLYRKEKRSRSPSDTQAFKTQNWIAKYLINTARDEHVNNYILSNEGLKTKQFWKYII